MIAINNDNICDDRNSKRKAIESIVCNINAIILNFFIIRLIIMMMTVVMAILMARIITIIITLSTRLLPIMLYLLPLHLEK